MFTVTKKNFSTTWETITSPVEMPRTHFEGTSTGYATGQIAAIRKIKRLLPRSYEERRRNPDAPAEYESTPTLYVEFGCNRDERVYNLDDREALAELARDLENFLLGERLAVDEPFDEFCNQATREMWVTSISRGRGFRVAYELPTCEKAATRYGFKPSKNSDIRVSDGKEVVFYCPQEN